MVNQVNKEMKSKKIYKGIVIGVGLLLLVFILINGIWLFNITNKYSYLDKNWEFKNSTHSYKEDGIYMTVQKSSIKDEFKFFYLKYEPLSVVVISGNVASRDYQPIANISKKNEVFTLLPIDKRESQYNYIRIDKNGKILDDNNNPDFMIRSGFLENRKFVYEFLEEHNNDFKFLYKKANEQFKLVNKLKEN